MATQNIVSEVKHSAVVPFVVPVPSTSVTVITQAEIVSLLNLQAQINRLKERAAEDEKSIMLRLQTGAGVEEGAHVARIKESSRAAVAWKDKAIDLAIRLGMDGKAWAANVLSHTAKTTTTSLHIE